jgi:hypothetical protein
MMSKLNSRKLIASFVTFFTSVGLLWEGKLESGDFATITVAIVGAYMASRAWVDGKNAQPEK